RYGFADANLIWSHPDNEALRNRRRSMHVLAPGDIVAIPDPRKKSVQRETDKVHQFTVRLPTRGVHLILVDANHQPITDSPYVLHVGSETRSGRTGGSGEIVQAGFDPSLVEGT